MKRKTWKTLLLAVVLLSLLCSAAQAASSGFCGVNNAEDASWTLNDEGELVITGTGEIGYGGWEKNSVLTVMVGEGISGLGNSIFQNHVKAITISLPSTLKSIGYWAFANSGVKYLYLPSHIDSWDTKYAFYGCKSLESVTIPEGVTVIDDWAFNSCSSLASVAFPSTLTAIGFGAFNSTSLVEITIPEGVTNIGLQAFENCKLLENVSLPSTLENLELGAFGYCSAIKQIIIPNSVKRINGSFVYCTSLKSITIPDSVTFLGEGLCDGCTSLEYAEIHCSLDGYTIPKLFDNGCTALRQIILSDGPTSIGDGAFKNLPALESVTLPSTLTTIGESAFQGCTGLETIDFPSSLTRIGKSAFSGCTALGVVTLPVNLEEILEGAFQGCSSLTLPNGFPDTLELIHNNAFEGCTSITSITLPESLKSLFDYAFRNCTGLTSVVFPDYVVDVRNGVFQGCTSLQHVTLPEGQRGGDGEGMFSGCTSLTTIDIPVYTVTSGTNHYVPTEYCKDCTSLKTVRLGAGTKIIKASAFSGCESLISITLPPELTTVEEGAFHNCNALMDVFFGGTEERWNAIRDFFPADVTVHYVDEYHPLSEVYITRCQHGTVEVEPINKKTDVYYDMYWLITAIPEDGYQLKMLTVTDARGGLVDLVWERDGYHNGDYRFWHRSEYVTVTAEFELISGSGGGTKEDPRQLTAEEIPTVLYPGWYAVAENITAYSTIMIRGDVHLVLNAGKTLRARAGVNVSQGNSLTVSGNGTLSAFNLVSGSHAAIGGGHGEDAGVIIIDSGTVVAVAPYSAAAIGGGMRNNDEGGNAGAITINGGTVTATGKSGYPGIGGASGGTIIINGGNVTATGSTSGAMNNIPRSSPGIGGSSSSGAIVTINGGVVHAIGGTQAAAIGSGTFAPDGASTVTIGNGMKVTVKGAAAPVLAGDRVNACAENDVTVAPCGHDAEVIFSPTAEMNCTRCSLTGPYPAYGNGTSDNPWKIRTALRVSELPSGWYEVTESTDYENRISVNGSVNLILGEGTTLDASHGIHVTGENALIISGSGTLNATAPNSPDDRESWGCAGIGGNQGEDGGFLIINSGSVKATGSVFGAGIGGGSNGGNGGNITINGGMVTAGFDGAYNEEAGLAAAIGGGDTGSGGIILITGGAVRAEGRRGSAGIGGGGYGSGGTITITGGFVTAIGASYPNGRSAAGIGAGRVRNKATSGDSGNITITGGTVIAVGGENAQAIGVSNEVAENDSGTLILGRSLVVTAGESESTAVVATDDLLAACRSPWVKVELFIPAFGEPDFILPGFLTTVGEKAFEGAAMQIVLVQAGCTAIGNYAFRNCMNLTEIRIPDGCTIGTDAFDGCPLVFVYGTADDSPAKKYCDTHENCVFVKETQN